MLELLSAKEITKINVEYLQTKGYNPTSKEIQNIHQIIQDDRNSYMLVIEDFKINTPFNNIKLTKYGKGYFLLDYNVLFKHMTNLSSLDKNTYYKAIISEIDYFKKNRKEKMLKKEGNDNE